MRKYEIALGGTCASMRKYKIALGGTCASMKEPVLFRRKWGRMYSVAPYEYKKMTIIRH
ncbi:MAG: hypothetical protein LBE11_08235 [Prevotellaceae bacterium]|nr:hypothetical protein [Prevotellaceae bacterium]